MNRVNKASAAMAAAGAVLGLMAAPAMAQTPEPWQMGFQTAHSPVQVGIENLHDLVLGIITGIVILVAGLLAIVLFRFSSKRNPTASRNSHNTLLEVAWTLVPALILIVIAIPSFRLVYFEDRTRDADLTIKATGHQWYWEYTYPDQGKIDFSSYVVPSDQLKPGQLRLLDVDNPLVVPVGKNIRVLTTSGDVIHSFFIPSLGVQRYAVPGRTIETWFKIDKPGHYYGECNQICGTNHSQMPISIEAVTPEAFATWVEEAKTKFADGATAPATASAVRLAAAQFNASPASLTPDAEQTR